MRAQLDNPLTLNPQTATRLELRGFAADCDRRVLMIRVELTTNAGVVLESRNIEVGPGAAVNNWITANENTILTQLLQKLGIGGTIV